MHLYPSQFGWIHVNSVFKDPNQEKVRKIRAFVISLLLNFLVARHRGLFRLLIQISEDFRSARPYKENRNFAAILKFLTLS